MRVPPQQYQVSIPFSGKIANSHSPARNDQQVFLQEID